MPPRKEWTPLHHRLYILFTLTLLLLCSPIETAASRTQTPYQAEVTTAVHVRKGPNTSYTVKGTLQRGEVVTVTDDKGAYHWLQIESRFGQGWVYYEYLRPVSTSLPAAETRSSTSCSRSVWNISLWDIIKSIIGIGILIAIISAVWDYIISAIVILFYLARWVIRIVAWPFFLTNTLQRYLAKPWIIFFHHNHFSDSTNEVLRTVFAWLKVPLYVLLTPVRLLNAVFFNIVVHCSYEFLNYILEILAPTQDGDGADDLLEWIIYLPKRLWKYGIYHPALTILESAIWTVIDTFIPALTLYHGTSAAAAESIVSCPYRSNSNDGYTGIWNVGSGNFAGNGIYFAPARSTSEHYSSGSMITCRVTLGRTLDLGLAPRHVYRECGHSNALSATRWGLTNGYVTGEWWRSDARWWEYCMYDWQNRYNYSWRIRPLYVIDLDENIFQRTPCGMAHWLFQKMVLRDLAQSIRETLE